LVERDLAKVEVVGSRPITRSTSAPERVAAFSLTFPCHGTMLLEARESGLVAFLI
jgi:hypothetical protein